jgi:hypothetical protein
MIYFTVTVLLCSTRTHPTAPHTPRARVSYSSICQTASLWRYLAPSRGWRGCDGTVLTLWRGNRGDIGNNMALCPAGKQTRAKKDRCNRLRYLPFLSFHHAPRTPLGIRTPDVNGTSFHWHPDTRSTISISGETVLETNSKGHVSKSLLLCYL